MALTKAALIDRPIIPGGRITLSTGVPVMTSDVSNAATVYYTPYLNALIPVWDGSNWDVKVFSELSNVLANSSTGSAGPAAGAADQNYDLFVWDNSGTLTLTRGPVWTNATTRSAGTALVRQDGIWLNNAAITNGPAASRGTYVGTIRTDSSAAQVDWELGGVAAGGDPGFLYVWNMYNRVPVSVTVSEDTTSWTYGVSTTWRAVNASSTNSISMVLGLREDAIFVYHNIGGLGSASGRAICGIGIDSTTVLSGTTGQNGSDAIGPQIQARYTGQPGLGYHKISAIEYTNDGTSAVVFYGNLSGLPDTVQGLHLLGMF